MAAERTLEQTGEELRQAQAQSLEHLRPPTQVPGYEPQRCLGEGAYGEVWLAVERNTGRLVAIKFYTHRGGLDWSLLSGEVEKLARLSADRYVVQLIAVGWKADPPFYVMEYLEQGSLEARLQSGPLPAGEAAALFREVAVGLVHSHGKGVLHCDLKPANVLLDQDSKPRLADFGQSRLSHEQTPALGTLFYMAPEQADLSAVPDAGWDVYALGALLYAMLTGEPPYRTQAAAAEIECAENLPDRLTAYRRLIAAAPKPAAHRRVPGVDRELAEIIDRCLAPNPAKRFPNAQAVLNALDQRSQRRARRPLLVLGALGPALLLAVMALFAWTAFSSTIDDAERELYDRAVDSNLLMAQSTAHTTSQEIERYYHAVEKVAADPRLVALLREAAADAKLTELAGKIDAADRLADPTQRERQVREFQDGFRRQPVYGGLTKLLEQWQGELQRGDESHELKVASLVVDNALGTALARWPASDTTGRNFCHRTYFHGGADDKPAGWRAGPGDHITRTHVSAVFKSTATGNWVVGISTPVWNGRPSGDFLGIVVLTIEVRYFIDKFQGREEQFAVLVDGRGANRGLILQHPLFDELDKDFDFQALSDPKYRVRLEAVWDEDHLPNPEDKRRESNYQDPLGAHPAGAKYNRKWVAAKAPVFLERKGKQGILPLVNDRRADALFVVVQEDYQAPVRKTGHFLVNVGLAALGVGIALLTSLWGFVIVVLNESSRSPMVATIRRSVGLPTTGYSTSSGTPRQRSLSSVAPSVSAGLPNSGNAAEFGGAAEFAGPDSAAQPDVAAIPKDSVLSDAPRSPEAGE